MKSEVDLTTFDTFPYRQNQLNFNGYFRIFIMLGITLLYTTVDKISYTR